MYFRISLSPSCRTIVMAIGSGLLALSATARRCTPILVRDAITILAGTFSERAISAEEGTLGYHGHPRCALLRTSGAARDPRSTAPPRAISGLWLRFVYTLTDLLSAAQGCCSGPKEGQGSTELDRVPEDDHADCTALGGFCHAREKQCNRPSIWLILAVS